MLNNLASIFAYWFQEGDHIEWIPEDWVKWLWYAAMALAVLFFLIIVVLFFKEIGRAHV